MSYEDGYAFNDVIQDGKVDAIKAGRCCCCGYEGQEETECPKRQDKTHCVHWWDGPGEQ